MTNVDRARLARELHDGIAQDLVGVGYSLDLLLANPETSMDARSQIRALRFTVTELIDKVRREIYFLRQTTAVSLTESIKKTAQEECGNLQLHLNVEEISSDIDSELSYEIQQIAREVLRNIAAHAQAHVVTITLQSNEKIIELYIADDGIGGAVASDEHYGLQGIRDRAKAIKGVVEIDSDKNGTRICLQLPITQSFHE